MGRFVGPVALFDRAKELLPELKTIATFSWEWRGWVDLLEGSVRSGLPSAGGYPAPP
jgi:hypothetical protein